MGLLQPTPRPEDGDAARAGSKFFPALLSLLGPALDPSVPEKPEQAINAVDLVVTLVKQLAEVPNTTAGPHAGALERLVLAYAAEGLLTCVVALTRLVERREFRRVTVVLMDLLYQLLRGQEPDALLRARKEYPALRDGDAWLDASAASAGVPSGDAQAFDEDSEVKIISDGPSSHSQRAQGSDRKPAATDPRNDPLAQARSRERAARSAAALMAGVSTRHSRFGSMYEMKLDGSGGGGGARKSLILSNPLKFVSSGAGGAMAIGHAERRGGGGAALLASDATKRRAAKGGGGDTLTQPLRLDVSRGVGMGAGAGVSTVSGELVGRARAVLAQAALDLLATTIVEVKAKQKKHRQKQKRRRGEGKDGAGRDIDGAEPLRLAGDGEPEGEAQPNKAEADTEADGGSDADAEDSDDEEEEEEEDEDEGGVMTLQSGFATLTAALKSRFLRDSDELVPEDKLRYLHLTGIMLGVHRLAHAQRLKDAQAAAKLLASTGSKPADMDVQMMPSSENATLKSAAPAGSSPGEKDKPAPPAALPGLSAEPVLTVLDRWSFNSVASMLDEQLNKRVSSLQILYASSNSTALFTGLGASCHHHRAPQRAVAVCTRTY
jgi:hypothetical protein